MHFRDQAQLRKTAKGRTGARSQSADVPQLTPPLNRSGALVFLKP